MEKLTSTFTLFIVGLCILSCNRSDVNKNSSTSEAVAILKVDATGIDQNREHHFITDSNFSTLKLVADDDRKL